MLLVNLVFNTPLHVMRREILQIAMHLILPLRRIYSNWFYLTTYIDVYKIIFSNILQRILFCYNLLYLH